MGENPHMGACACAWAYAKASEWVDEEEEVAEELAVIGGETKGVRSLGAVGSCAEASPSVARTATTYAIRSAC